jgi:hypothetical protein
LGNHLHYFSVRPYFRAVLHARLEIILINQLKNPKQLQNMKTVFQSQSELASVFATQKQFNGRTTSMFFQRETAYSYGFHYIAAKFLTANNGEKV